MSENVPQATPLAKLISEAQDGRLNVTLSDDVRSNAEEFAFIERDCEAFKHEIQKLQRIATNISTQKKWGLGEDQAPLTSAQAVVHRFRSKAAVVDQGKDSSNTVYDILQQHYEIVDDLQQLHRTIAQRYIATDQEFAARYNELLADMPTSPIGADDR
ncbi:hypothetical protein [Nocardia sp. alder85J]|uniref:hypothetical protein n=1 Tax=Nocardia sp. alder85J TaxID=2862949 RepID=UPI001CD4E635|nr:hypothetical protein [Nocardia sp. alder85J]MCX4097099.1 hypothetical protein [Nocardia sp. alder85J]